MQSPLKLLLIIAVTFPMVSGCATINPYIQDLNIISTEQEKLLGAQFSNQISQQMPVIKNARSNEYVEGIGRQLLSTLPPQPFDYQFFVVDDKSPNAFAIPGGKIYVHTGLLDFAESRDELAGVIAHEIGHGVERHPTKSMTRTYGLQFISSLLLKDNPSRLKVIATQLASGAIKNKYSRDDEREADVFGYYLLRDAGFQTSGLLRFLRKLEKLHGGKNPPAFFSTHPPTPERIIRLEELERIGRLIQKS